MSIILGLDTSTASLGVGLIDNGIVIVSCIRSLHQSHAEHIAHAIQFVLESAQIQPHAISKAAVVTGPGSFTGLRIGIAFIKGFFLQRNVPILSISSLYATAYASAALIKTGKLSVLFAGSQNNVFYSRFTLENGSIIQAPAITIMNIDTCIQSLSTEDTVIYDPNTMTKAPIMSKLRSLPQGINANTLGLNRGCAAALHASQTDIPLSQWTNALDLEPAYFQSSYVQY